MRTEIKPYILRDPMLRKKVEVGPIGGGHVKQPVRDVDPESSSEIFRKWFRENGNI